MPRTARLWTPALAAACLVLLGAGGATADTVVVPAGVECYYTPPAVSYYAAPAVYAPAPRVAYYTPSVSYYVPAVSYYTPSVSYYAPVTSYYAAPTAVTTTRYGLFGRPRVSTTAYYP
jgi:hypothetical protein